MTPSIQEFRNSGIQGFLTSGRHDSQNSGIQEFRNSRILGIMSPKIQAFLWAPIPEDHPPMQQKDIQRLPEFTERSCLSRPFFESASMALLTPFTYIYIHRYTWLILYLGKLLKAEISLSTRWWIFLFSR